MVLSTTKKGLLSNNAYWEVSEYTDCVSLETYFNELIEFQSTQFHNVHSGNLRKSLERLLPKLT